MKGYGIAGNGQGRLPVKTLAYGLSIICVIVAIMYFVLPGGSLPTFFPGYAVELDARS